MQSNVWLKSTATIYIGGDPAKGKAPQITITLTNPQILVDHDKNTITIIETK